MSLPDYDARKRFSIAYGWELVGWDAKPRPDSTVLLSRWEDAEGRIVEAPPTIECDPPREGVRQHVIVDGQPHQTFLRLPHYAPISTWESLLFEHMVRRTMAAG
jgi:hypothetical protein